MTTTDKINEATLTDAKAWAATTERFTFCIDFLEISAHSRAADRCVDLLETRFEELLGVERGALDR